MKIEAIIPSRKQDKALAEYSAWNLPCPSRIVYDPDRDKAFKKGFAESDADRIILCDPGVVIKELPEIQSGLNIIVTRELPQKISLNISEPGYWDELNKRAGTSTEYGKLQIADRSWWDHPTDEVYFIDRHNAYHIPLDGSIELRGVVNRSLDGEIVKKLVPFSGEVNDEVDIFVVRFNHLESEGMCLRSVKQNTSYPYRLTVFDNYYSRFSLSRLWNFAMSFSQCKYICLLNSDAFPTPGWLTELMRPFADEKTSATGPSGDRVGGIQRQVSNPEASKSWAGRYLPSRQLSGFCTVLRKSTGIEFPEDVPFYGGEHAWFVKSYLEGFNHYWALGSFVYHIGEASADKAGIKVEYRDKGLRDYSTWLAGITPILYATHNNLDLIKQTLPALLESKTGLIIVFDNASTDGTVEWLNDLHHPKLQCVFNDANKGITGAMNCFFDSNERYEFVAKVDPDTLVPKDWLSELLLPCVSYRVDLIQAKYNPRGQTFRQLIANCKSEVRDQHIFYARKVGGTAIAINREKVGKDRLRAEDDSGWDKFQSEYPMKSVAYCDAVSVKMLGNEEMPEILNAVQSPVELKVKGAFDTLTAVGSRIGKRFAFTRFGDGELRMIDGWEGRDITQYNSPKFQRELEESFRIDHPDYLIGLTAGMPREDKAEKGLFAPFGSDEALRKIARRYQSGDKTYYSPIAFHYYYVFERLLFDYFMKVIGSKKVMFIGGEHLAGIKINIEKFVTVPSTQAYDTIDSWYPEVENCAKDFDVILMCIAITANVVQKRLWLKGIEVGTIDFGSVANAMTNQNPANHTWIKKLNEAA